MIRPVDFFIVGAMKSGTSSLRAVLAAHPAIAMYPREIHYFSHDPYFAHGRDWYDAHFEALRTSLLLGEKSADYMSGPHAAARIAEYNPNAKLVFILRHPLQRALSHYKHAMRRAQRRALGDPSAAPALTLEQDLAGEDVGWPGRGYLCRSQYDRHFARFDAHFAPEQMLVLVLEEVLRAPAAALAALQLFLTIDALPQELPHSNPSPAAAAFPLAAATVNRLRAALAPTVEAMEQRLGRALPAWRV